MNNAVRLAESKASFKWRKMGIVGRRGAFQVIGEQCKYSLCIVDLSEIWLAVCGRCSREPMPNGAALAKLRPQ